MEDRDWLILETLHEHKNITKTAQALFISQPALTARLRNIEEEFGVKIVYRTSKGVHFTPQGEYLANASANVLFTLRKIKEHVADMNSHVSGTLRLGASSYFTVFSLPQLLKHFKLEYPHVEFKVTTAWSRDVFNRVHNQDIHIGFVSSDYGWQGKRYLLYEEPVCIVSASEIDIENLPKMPRINYQTDALIKAMIDKWWRDNFVQPPSISMDVDKLVTCREMVINGLGYAFMPSNFVSNIDGLHKIILFDREGNPLLRRSWMLYHEELMEMNIVSAFVNSIKQIDFSKLISSRL